MKHLAYLTTFIFVLSLSVFGFNPVAPTAPKGPKIKVMVLGSHFMPHDVLRSSRQKEVSALVESLSRFSPDKVLLDVPSKSLWEKQMNKDYQQFISGTYILNRSPREQVGFRLAAELGHSGVFGVDTESGFNLSASLFSSPATNNNFQAAEDLIRLGRGIESAKQEHLNYGSVSNYFSYLNNPQNLAYEHGIYVRGFTQVGGHTKASGTSILADWYKYHMDILSNLNHIVADGDERVMLIMDSSFIPVLKELIDADPRYEWVEASRFLNVQ